MRATTENGQELVQVVLDPRRPMEFGNVAWMSQRGAEAYEERTGARKHTEAPIGAPVCPSSGDSVLGVEGKRSRNSDTNDEVRFSALGGNRDDLVHAGRDSGLDVRSELLRIVRVLDAEASAGVVQKCTHNSSPLVAASDDAVRGEPTVGAGVGGASGIQGDAPSQLSALVHNPGQVPA